MKILCAGDIHMGRRPSRLPDVVDRGALSCSLMWPAIVDRAIAEDVELVALSGDVVDETNKYYEAIGPLEAGIRKLWDRGIRTVAVAGNHDHDVLPRLSESLPAEAFRLLGRDARWERHTVHRDGRAVLHVDGWSFAGRSQRDDPLRGYALADPEDVPVLGLLHCDLDQPRSIYAPVQLADLLGRRVGFWLLGHVHAARPFVADGAATVLYPGSPQAMDPGEPGVHGVWLAELDAGGRFSARQIPLATVRYETADIDIGGLEDEGELGPRITDVVRRELARRLEEGCGPLRYLSLRLRLTGSTALHRRLDRITATIGTDLQIEQDGVRAIVERVSAATRPARDLEALAKAGDAPGELARLVLGLRGLSQEAEHEQLVARALRAAHTARASTTYAALPADEIELSADQVKDLLAEQALFLLDEILAQKEEA